ncbi:MAG: Hsp33 family molecular chaperone HslO [Polyangiaceae bacterium]|nr:Hsp33 family molecular chaperone HslO [Polyangiaceae bacterium]
MNPPADTVVRALTQDGSFRVIATFTTQTVQAVIKAQQTSGTTAEQLGELVTGAILVREAMAPGYRVQAILQGAQGGGSLVADSHPDGTNRGIVNLGGRREVNLSNGGLLQVMRTMPKGVHQGVVQVPRGGGIPGALMAYMQESEQVASVISVCTLLGNDGNARSAGFFVQLLPEAERSLLMIMTERLDSFPPLRSLLQNPDLTPQGLLDEILYGMPFTVTSNTEVRFGCQCSRERLLASLATLPQAEIASMIHDNKPLDIRCDGCGEEYVIGVDELLPMVQPGGMFGRATKPGDA